MPGSWTQIKSEQKPKITEGSIRFPRAFLEYCQEILVICLKAKTVQHWVKNRKVEVPNYVNVIIAFKFIQIAKFKSATKWLTL